MANTIKLKRASGSDPSNSDLSAGELAIRTSNCKLFSKNDSGSAIGIVAGSADTLTTARTIAGVSFDGSANISLNNNAITNGAGYITTVADTTIAPSEIDMGDNEKIKLGDSQDAQIYHSGSSFHLFNQTGNLHLNGDTILIKNYDNDESYIRCYDDGSVELYHDNSKKFETTSSGGTLTGTLTATGLTLSGSVGAAITAASDGSTITLDLGANTHQSVTLGGNRTFAAPSNQTVGQSGSIFITQDGTGSRTASFNSAFKFVGGTAPTLSTSANAVDRIDYVIKSSNVIHCAISLDVK